MFKQPLKRDVSPDVKLFGQQMPKESEYMIIKDHRPRSNCGGQQRHNIFYRSNVTFY
jgi:hypothetical protein